MLDQDLIHYMISIKTLCKLIQLNQLIYYYNKLIHVQHTVFILVFEFVLVYSMAVVFIALTSIYEYQVYEYAKFYTKVLKETKEV